MPTAPAASAIVRTTRSFRMRDRRIRTVGFTGQQVEGGGLQSVTREDGDTVAINDMRRWPAAPEACRCPSLAGRRG